MKLAKLVARYGSLALMLLACAGTGTGCRGRSQATQVPAARYDVNAVQPAAYYQAPPSQTHYVAATSVNAAPPPAPQNYGDPNSAYANSAYADGTNGQVAAGASAPPVNPADQAYEQVTVDNRLRTEVPEVQGGMGYETTSTGQKVTVVTYVHTYPQPVETYSRVWWSGRWYYNVNGNFVFWDPWWGGWSYYWGPPMPLVYAWNYSYPWMAYSWGAGFYGWGWYWGGVGWNGYHGWGVAPTWYTPARRGDGGGPRIGAPAGNARPNHHAGVPSTGRPGRVNGAGGRPNGASSIQQGNGRPNGGRPNSVPGVPGRGRTNPSLVPANRGQSPRIVPGRAQPRGNATYVPGWGGQNGRPTANSRTPGSPRPMTTNPPGAARGRPQTHSVPAVPSTPRARPNPPSRGASPYVVTPGRTSSPSRGTPSWSGGSGRSNSGGSFHRPSGGGMHMPSHGGSRGMPSGGGMYRGGGGGGGGASRGRPR